MITFTYFHLMRFFIDEGARRVLTHHYISLRQVPRRAKCINTLALFAAAGLLLFRIGMLLMAIDGMREQRRDIRRSLAISRCRLAAAKRQSGQRVSAIAAVILHCRAILYFRRRPRHYFTMMMRRCRHDRGWTRAPSILPSHLRQLSPCSATNATSRQRSRPILTTHCRAGNFDTLVTTFFRPFTCHSRRAHIAAMPVPRPAKMRDCRHAALVVSRMPSTKCQRGNRFAAERRPRTSAPARCWLGDGYFHLKIARRLITLSRLLFRRRLIFGAASRQSRSPFHDDSGLWAAFRDALSGTARSYWRRGRREVDAATSAATFARPPARHGRAARFCTVPRCAQSHTVDGHAPTICYDARFHDASPPFLYWSTRVPPRDNRHVAGRFC